MSSFGQYLRELREKRGFSLNQLAMKAGVSNAHISRLERGLRPAPSPEIIARLAGALHVSYEDLMKAAGYLDSKATELPAAVWPPGTMVKVPVLGAIRSGLPLYAHENIEGYEVVPAGDAGKGEYFFLRVADDSMTGARIFAGDLVYVRRQDYVEDGAIAVVVVDGKDATLKRVYYQGDIVILQPENPKYKPVVFQGKEKDQLQIIGKVLRVTFSLP